MQLNYESQHLDRTYNITVRVVSHRDDVPADRTMNATAWQLDTTGAGRSGSLSLKAVLSHECTKAPHDFDIVLNLDVNGNTANTIRKSVHFPGSPSGS